MAAAAPADIVVLKAEVVEDNKTKATNGEEAMNGGENGMKAAEDHCEKKMPEKDMNGKKAIVEAPKEEVKEEDIPVEVEPKTGISFPVRLVDGKLLNCAGMRKKSMLGIYADNEKLKEVMKTKIGKAPAKPTKEMYQAFIDSDVEMVIRLVIVYSGLTITMVRKSFNEGIGAAIKKLIGGKNNDDLANKVMGQAKDDIKLTPGSMIEITRLPGHTLETKGKNIKM
ncbi:hypothetical protein ACFE04_008973 [Oxalis oulophora]